MKKKISICVFVFIFLVLGSGWAKEFHVTTAAEFQAALTEAQENGEDDIIYMAEGIYYGGFSYNASSSENYALTIMAKPGLGPEQVILDGNNSQRVLYLYDMSTWHNNANFGLEGVTIQNGYESGGGGVHVKSRLGKIVFTDNVIAENTAEYCDYNFGGGVCAYSQSGGINFTNNTITANRVQGINTRGGGISVDSMSGMIILTNNLIAENILKAYGRGGGVYIACESGTVTLVNNTITGNTATLGGGFYGWYISNVVNAYFYNNIMWGNTAEHDIYFYGNSACYGYNNDYHNLSGAWTNQAGNKDVDPLFVDPEKGDYHLQPDSLCIDKGTNDVPELPEKDMDGKPRIIDGDGDGEAVVDMGVYEFGDICEGDFNNDGDVDGSDLAVFAADFGRTDCDQGEDCEGDFDHDNDVDGSDLAVFAADFGRTDCPINP